MIPNELEAIPAAMAAAIAPLLGGVDRAAYARFLSAMAHYTRGSEARLRHAARLAEAPSLRGFFARLADEEAGHDALAEADLAALGARATDAPPEAVVAFHRAWVSSARATTWLGALYPLENVARHLAGEVPSHLARLGLEPSQARFIATHLRADPGHGDAVEAQLRGLLEGEGREARARELVEAARYAAAFWVDLHRDAFAAAPPGRRP